MMNKTPKEIKIPLYDNYHLSAKHWPCPGGIRVLGLHGWLDNAATYDTIAPLLEGIDLVALDFGGHGHSSHKEPASFFHILDLVIESFKVASTLGWDTFSVIGHSLGAAIASYMGGTQPDKISQMILLDGLGAFTTPASLAPKQLQHMIETQAMKKTSKPPMYASLEEAMSIRQKATPMNAASAKALVSRGIKKHQDKVTWRTDPRLLQPSAIHLTEEQTLAFLERITAKTLVIRAEPGFPFNPELMKNRLSCLKKLEYVTVKGHHHAHLDQPEIFAPLIQNFLLNS